MLIVQWSFVVEKAFIHSNKKTDIRSIKLILHYPSLCLRPQML